MFCYLNSQIPLETHVTAFFVTANLKTAIILNQIEGFFWFIVVNVALKTQITRKFALIVAHHFTALVNSTLEAIRNTTSA